MEIKDIQCITHSNLKLLGIRDLRKLAFAVGVYGFTLYNKSDLIVHIVDVIYGREAPKSETSKGRPTSITKSRTEIISSIIEKIKLLKSADQFDVKFQDAFVASSSDEYDTGFAPNELIKSEIEVYGFVEKLKNYYCVRAQKNNSWTTPCLISQQTANNLNLRYGQKISGTAKLQNDGHYYLSSVHEKFENLPPYDNMEICRPTTKLAFGKGPFEIIDKLCPIAKGCRVVISGTTKTLTEWQNELLISLKKHHLVVASSYAAPEAISDLKDKFSEVFAAGFNEDEECQKRNINLAFERAKRLAEKYGDAVLAITSLPSTIKAFDMDLVLSVASGKTTSNYGLVKLRQSCLMAHNTKTGKSITLIVFAECDNAIQQAMVEQISEVFTTKIVCTNKQSSNFPIDAEKSNTLYSIN